MGRRRLTRGGKLKEKQIDTVMFVVHTPGYTLTKCPQKAEDKFVEKKPGGKVKMVSRGGSALQDILCDKNPWRRLVVDAKTASSVDLATQEDARKKGQCTPLLVRSASQEESLHLIGVRPAVQDTLGVWTTRASSRGRMTPALYGNTVQSTMKEEKTWCTV